MAHSGAGASVTKLFFGTSGWTDPSLAKCGRFYPANVKTAEERLAIYSKLFGVVEVNTSTYAVPRPAQVTSWVSQVPAGFKFHFKAFGLFCSGSVALSALPYEIKQTLPADADPSSSWSLAKLGDERVDEIWALFHASLKPAQDQGKLGCVMFQFHLNFGPSKANRDHVLWCRSKLNASIPMAVEFRDRSWFSSPASCSETKAFLQQHNIILIAADELRHETYQPDRAQTGLPPGETRQILPIALERTHESIAYIRLHRRHGTHERILPSEEVEAWADRLTQIASTKPKEIHFLIGTDWEDAPIVNQKSLAAAVQRKCPELYFDWKKHCAEKASAGKGSLAALFAKAAANLTKRPREEDQEEAGGGAGENVDKKLSSVSSPGPKPTPPSNSKKGASSAAKNGPPSGVKPLTSFFAKK